MSHPPYAHNPHVYDFVDPNVVVTQRDIPQDSDAEPVEQSGEAVADEQAIDYDLFTKADLVAHIEELNKARDADNQLPTTGNKPDLVQRIQDAEAAAAEPAGE